MWNRTKWCDTMRINRGMRFGIVKFNMIKVGCRFECIVIPIKVSQILMNVWIIMSNHSDVTFKMLVIDWIKSDQSRV